MVQNLGSYLRVPPFHDKVTNSTLRFVVDRVRNKFQSREARKLSLVGRATRTQSVLLTIHSYFMQSMMILNGLCDKIEHLVRQCIWGSSRGKRKMMLVSWEPICQPRSCRGFGIRRLKNQNTSFLMKLGFNIVSNSNTLWI